MAGEKAGMAIVLEMSKTAIELSKRLTRIAMVEQISRRSGDAKDVRWNL